MVDSILPLKHNGKLTIRMSMNPEEIIKKVDVHTKINEEAFPTAINLYNRQIMTGRGKGKYSYNKDIRAEATVYLEDLMHVYVQIALDLSVLTDHAGSRTKTTLLSRYGG